MSVLNIHRILLEKREPSHSFRSVLRSVLLFLQRGTKTLHKGEIFCELCFQTSDREPRLHLFLKDLGIVLLHLISLMVKVVTGRPSCSSRAIACSNRSSVVCFCRAA